MHTYGALEAEWDIMARHEYLKKREAGGAYVVEGSLAYQKALAQKRLKAKNEKTEGSGKAVIKRERQDKGKVRVKRQYPHSTGKGPSTHH